MQKLKGELVIIHNAISRTKQEIATLHVTGFHGESMSRMTHELDAVVSGTEQATQTILNMVEDIDQFATTLIESAPNAAEQEIGRSIQERVVKVFEACNFPGHHRPAHFQGRRHVEIHRGSCRTDDEYLGRHGRLQGIPSEAPPERQGDAALLNGPKLEEDVGHVSQDDIDALFP